ncbi:MAG: uracil-DNA glycosylase [Gemmatimonadaceae bacterium]
MRDDELLRRYLEQQREMGERELVLDGMTADELRGLLAAARGEPGLDRARGERRSTSAPAREAAPVQDAGDWRSVLRAADRGEPPQRQEPAERDRAEELAPVSSAKDFAPPPSTPQSTKVAPLVSGLVVGAGERELFGGPVAQLESIEALAAMVAACTRCPLYATATMPVPGEGNVRARLMCVGEAPGAQEDATGRPFVGQAGQLLTKILGAINLNREDVYIANVLKHRPPGNRNPRPEEVEACRPYLVRQIELIRPKVLIAFGTFAAQSLLQTKLAIGKLRGQVHRYHGIPVIVTYHPAALLRNPAWKRPAWEDVQLARRLLDSAPA